MDEERIKSGIPGLDELIEGGIPRNAIVLVSGAPGSGKSIFSLQFIVEGARRGERGLYVSLEQTEEDIKLQSRRFGWDLDKLIKKGLITLRSYMPAIEVYKTKEEVIRSILPLPIDHHVMYGSVILIR